MKVLWFTGLSGSGKTTIAEALSSELKQIKKKCLVLDGDFVRNTLHKELSFTPEDIRENNRRMAELCKDNLDRYDYILVPIISPFLESRNHARRLLSPDFIEVYIKADLEECKRRDVKGLYKKALSGAIENFIGISPHVPYQAPDHAEIVIDTRCENVDSGVAKIISYLGLR